MAKGLRILPADGARFTAGWRGAKRILQSEWAFVARKMLNNETVEVFEVGSCGGQTRKIVVEIIGHP